MSRTLASPQVAAEVSARAGRAPTIGRWQLIRQLGEGQWTRVFQARPIDCIADWPSDYALKLLKEQFDQDPLAVGMLRREAEAGQAVMHPNLVAVLSAQLTRPPYFLVTPCLAGSTLAALLYGNVALTLPSALWIVRQVAEALEALHARQWLHADVKPSNIMVSASGHATLFDLGFARRKSSADPEQSLTGTLSYAAPELFISYLGPSESSDVYSLGVTLFEVLTGRVPHSAGTADELALAHVQQPAPDPRRFAPDLPPRVARLIRRMLAKDQLRRPRTSELIDILVALEIDAFDER